MATAAALLLSHTKRNANAIRISILWLLSVVVIMCITRITALHPHSSVLVTQSKRQHERVCKPTFNDRPCFAVVENKSLLLRSSCSSSSSTSSSRYSTRLSSLISPNDMWGNIAMLSTISSVALTLGSKTRIGRLLGPPVSGMALSFLLASIGILPRGGSPGATSLQSLSVSLATPLILLGADFRITSSSSSSSPRSNNNNNNTPSSSSSSSMLPLIGSFALASASTLIASCVGVTVCRQSLGRDGLKLAAALLAKNIGGGINYVAVCQTLQVSPASIAAGLCVDNIMALIYFPITSILASGRPDVVATTTTLTTSKPTKDDTITVASTSVALSVATVATWLGNMIAGTTATSIPCTTALTLLFASIMPSKLINFIRPSCNLIGTVLLYLFFATAGAPGMSCMANTSYLLSIAAFLCILYTIHGGLLVLCRALVLKLKQDEEGFVSPQRLLVASSAAIGGPATAAALAQANGWTSLVVPSMVVGNIGYAIATFIGLAFHAAFA